MEAQVEAPVSVRAWGNPRWRERRNLRAVHLALLGPLEVHTDEGLVSLGAPKERAVLEMLALRSGRPVPTGSRSSPGCGTRESPGRHPRSYRLTCRTYAERCLLIAL